MGAHLRLGETIEAIKAMETALESQTRQEVKRPNPPCSRSGGSRACPSISAAQTGWQGGVIRGGISKELSLLPEVQPEATLDGLSYRLQDLDWTEPFVTCELATARVAIPYEAEHQGECRNNDDGVLHN